MQLLAELTSGDLLSSGIYPGLTSIASPLWTDGENIVFDDQGVRKNYGTLGLANLPTRPTGIVSTFASSEARAFIGAGQEAYVYRSGSGLTNIGSFSAAAGQFQFVPWDTWCLINNTSDPVELWKNTGTSAVIAGIPFSRAAVIFQMGLRAFAANTDNGGNIVEWCSFNNIEDWLPSITNSAGSLPLRALVGDIVCCQPIGDSMGIYGNYNAGIFTQISGVGAYGFRRPIRGVSAVSQHSVVSLGDRHFGITPDNAFVTDLVSFQYIDEPAVRKWMLDNIDWSRQSEIYGWPDRANSVIRWAVPMLAGGTKSIGFRWDRGAWTRFNDDVVIGEQSGAFQHMLMATSTRLLRQDKTSANNDGSALASYLQTKPLNFGQPGKIKRIQQIDLQGSWSGEVKLKIGYTNTPNETPSWALTVDVTSQIGIDVENTECEGAYVHLRLESTAKDANWRLAGANIWGKYTGEVAHVA